MSSVKVQHKETWPYLTNYSSASSNPIKLLVINQLEQCCLYGSYARMRSVCRTPALAMSREMLVPARAVLLQPFSWVRGQQTHQFPGVRPGGLWMLCPHLPSPCCPQNNSIFYVSLEPRSKFSVMDDTDVTAVDIKHYSAHLMSHENKACVALLPFYLPKDFTSASQA